MFRLARRKQIRMVFLNDIDSLYPLLLCLLMAFCATLYESMQLFAPDTWQHFYFNPTLSPLHVPPVLAAFLIGMWLFIVVLLAALDDLFRQLSFTAAIAYLLGLVSCCIFCYVLFIFTTRIYIGYALLAGMAWLFVRRLRLSLRHPHYRCGRCGYKLGPERHLPPTAAPSTNKVLPGKKVGIYSSETEAELYARLERPSLLPEAIAQTFKIECGVISIERVAQPDIDLRDAPAETDAPVQSAVERLADGILLRPVNAPRTGIVHVQTDIIE